MKDLLLEAVVAGAVLAVATGLKFFAVTFPRVIGAALVVAGGFCLKFGVSAAREFGYGYERFLTGAIGGVAALIGIGLVFWGLARFFFASSEE